MSAYRCVVCDVFTDRPLVGNQLAVFPDAREIPDARLQPLAREINFSETVFAYPPTSGGDARIRIFTPKLEIPFAGHPVLGSAFVLGAPLEGDEIRLETGRGTVPVRLRREGRRDAPGEWANRHDQDRLLRRHSDGSPEALGHVLSSRPGDVVVDYCDYGARSPSRCRRVPDQVLASFRIRA